MKRRHIPLGADNFLSVLEGIEGGFAIFVGIIAGLYFQNISHELLIMTGVIGIIVNAFNSSAVRYASEHFLDELDGREKRSWFKHYFTPAVVEFITYVIVSIIAVMPLLLVQDTLAAITLTVAMTIVILFAAGFYRGKLLGRHGVRDGIELAGLGFAIVLVGATAGWIISLI